MTNSRTDDLVPLAEVPGNIIPWHFKRHQLSSFFPKTIIENGAPWQIPLFLQLSVQRIHLLGFVLLKVTGRFGPIPGQTPGRFSPILFLSGCIGLGHFSLISGVGPFCQSLVSPFGPLHFIQC